MQGTTFIVALALLTCCNGPSKSRTKTPTAATSAAAAEPAPVKAAPAEPMDPVTFKLAFDVSLEHGCSQSHESRGTDGTLVLEIDEKNQATLTVDAVYSSVFGPSFSKFQQGYDHFSSIHQKERSVWKGTAERTPSRIDITFDTVEAASIEWAQYGNPDLPEPTTSKASLTLACKTAPVEVYEPVKKDEYFWEVDDETPMVKDVLLCKPSGELFRGYGDMILEDEAVPLLDGKGLALESDVLFYNERLVIRLAG